MTVCAFPRASIRGLTCQSNTYMYNNYQLLRSTLTRFESMMYYMEKHFRHFLPVDSCYASLPDASCELP